MKSFFLFGFLVVSVWYGWSHKDEPQFQKIAQTLEQDRSIASTDVQGAVKAEEDRVRTLNQLVENDGQLPNPQEAEYQIPTNSDIITPEEQSMLDMQKYDYLKHHTGVKEQSK